MTAAHLLDALTRQVVPASKLTDAQRLEIRENKGELLALLRNGAPPAAEVPVPKAEPAAVATTPTPPRVETAMPESPPKPPLCPRCFPLGYPWCQECSLAHDPTLELHHGTLYRTRYPPNPVVKGWHRCERCNEPYEGVLPPFGTAKLCPKCLPGPLRLTF
jgi:hypothetical protein